MTTAPAHAARQRRQAERDAARASVANGVEFMLAETINAHMKTAPRRCANTVAPRGLADYEESTDG